MGSTFNPTPYIMQELLTAMREQLIGIFCMFLGSILSLLIRTALVIRSDFHWKILWGENKIRIYQIFSVLGVLNVILLLEGISILNVLSQFGFAVNVASNAAIGFIITAVITKLQVTDTQSVVEFQRSIRKSGVKK